MQYNQLEQQYQDDVLAEAIYGREVEHFHYVFDRDNFKRMIEGLPAGTFRSSLEQRLAETLDRIAQVESVHAALVARITDQARHADAVARVTAKRKAAAV